MKGCVFKMNETRLEIKSAQTEILSGGLKIILSRLNERMVFLQNNDKILDKKEFDSILGNLNKDLIIVSQQISENIEEIRDMIKES